MTIVITELGGIILFGYILIAFGILFTIAILDALEVRRITNDKTLTTSEKLRLLEEEGFK